MVEINFYHLEHSSSISVVTKLLEKAWGIEKRSRVVCPSPAIAEALDAELWTYSKTAFLPHGTTEESHAAQQPVLISSGMPIENLNQAAMLMTIHSDEAMDKESLSGYERVFDIFGEQQQESIQSARKRWAAYKEQGHDLIYWQQSLQGKWEKKNV